MTPQEHAEIWKKAAEVVAGMDTMRAEMNAAMNAAMNTTQSTGGWTGRCYGPEEAAANRAYSAAAVVLWNIASEYEKAGEEK